MSRLTLSIIRCIALVGLFLAGAQITSALNPSTRPPLAPTPDEAKVDSNEGQRDPCNNEGAKVGSFKFSLRFGGIPSEIGLADGFVIVTENVPSPQTFTPSILHYQHPAACR